MILEDEFTKWQPSLKVIAHEHARCYCAVELPGSSDAVAMSWCSDGVAPVLATREDLSTWLGVDQRIACVTDDGRIVVSLGLASSLVEIRCFRECTVVLCETEAVVFNNGDDSIRVIRGLPELPREIVERDGKIRVVLVDGRDESID